MKRYVKKLIFAPGAMRARATAGRANGPRFAGVYRNREAALAAVPSEQSRGYDDPSVADVSFDWMCKRQAFDYPVIYWLERLLPEGGTVIDVGGHMGTKFIAFQDVLDLGQTAWVVQDLPGIIAAARKRQAAGKLPAQISFVDSLENVPPGDMVLASGLLQYLGMSLGEFIAQFAQAPRAILVNKMPFHEQAFVTLERIDKTQVPYQVRTIADWQSEVFNAGYAIADSWPIAGLDHVIATHPWLGAATSRGYLLKLRD